MFRKFSLASAVKTHKTLPVRNIFRNDEEEGNDAPPPAPEGNVNKDEEDKPKGRYYTQEELNRIMKSDKDKAKRDAANLLNELTKLKEQGITPENFDSLNKRIETLTNEGKTKEQLAAEKADKERKNFQSQIEQEKTKVKEWQQKYETYRVKTEIFSAAVANEAVDPEQIYEIIRSRTKLIPAVDENGKDTGDIVPRVTLRAKQEDKEIDLELPVSEAIARMTEMPQYTNLFKSGLSGGLGGHNFGRNGLGGTPDPTNMSMKQYMDARGKGGSNLKNLSS